MDAAAVACSCENWSRRYSGPDVAGHHPDCRHPIVTDSLAREELRARNARLDEENRVLRCRVAELETHVAWLQARLDECYGAEEFNAYQAEKVRRAALEEMLAALVTVEKRGTWHVLIAGKEASFHGRKKKADNAAYAWRMAITERLRSLAQREEKVCARCGGTGSVFEPIDAKGWGFTVPCPQCAAKTPTSDGEREYESHEIDPSCPAEAPREPGISRCAKKTSGGDAGASVSASSAADAPDEPRNVEADDGIQSPPAGRPGDSSAATPAADGAPRFTVGDRVRVRHGSRPVGTVVDTDNYGARVSFVSTYGWRELEPLPAEQPKVEEPPTCEARVGLSMCMFARGHSGQHQSRSGTWPQEPAPSAPKTPEMRVLQVPILPTNEEDERIVDAMVSRSQAKCATRPIERQDPKPPEKEPAGEELTVFVDGNPYGEEWRVGLAWRHWRWFTRATYADKSRAEDAASIVRDALASHVTADRQRGCFSCGQIREEYERRIDAIVEARIAEQQPPAAVEREVRVAEDDEGWHVFVDDRLIVAGLFRDEAEEAERALLEALRQPSRPRRRSRMREAKGWLMDHFAAAHVEQNGTWVITDMRSEKALGEGPTLATAVERARAAREGEP